MQAIQGGQLVPQDSEAEVRQVKKSIHQESQRRIPGLKLWRNDLTTGEVTEVPLGEKTLLLPSGSIEYKVARQEDSWYCQALNKQNAVKKFKKRAMEMVERRFRQQKAEIDAAGGYEKWMESR